MVRNREIVSAYEKLLWTSRAAVLMSLFALLMLLVVHTKLMHVERSVVLLQDGIVEKNMIEAARIGQTVRPEVREVQ
ncbi:MAG: hypothetical protein U0105_17340 [Candidatus Obscuribacterales bacterium]